MSRQNRISGILDELRAEESELKGLLDKLKTEATSTNAELTKVRRAISSLSPQTNGTVSSTKKTASREEILQIATEILQREPHTPDELKGLVQSRISETGKSLTGFSMRFKGVLNDERFTESDGRIELRNGHRETAST